MPLKKGSPNASGLVRLILLSGTAVPNPQDALQPFLGQDEAAIADAVNALVVVSEEVGTTVVPPLGGGQDDGANITSKLAAGNVALVPGATYNLLSRIDYSGLSNRVLDLSSATLVAAMTQTGVQHSAIFGAASATGTTTTIAAGGIAYGFATINVASAANVAVGDTIQVIFTATATPLSYFKVLAKAGNVLTVDRPLAAFPFTVAGTVRTATCPRNITIRSTGATITGAGDRGIYCAGGIGVRVEGTLSVDVSQGTGLSGGIEFELGCVDCALVGTFNINGYKAAGGTDVFDYGARMASADRCELRGVRATHCTLACVMTFDCFESSFKELYGGESSTGLVTGLAVGGTVASNPGGCTDCEYEGLWMAAELAIPGWSYNLDRATRCNFTTLRGGLLQFGFSPATDVFFKDVQLVGSAAQAATGYGPAISAGTLTTNCTMEDVSVTDAGAIAGVLSCVEFQGDITVRGLYILNPNQRTIYQLRANIAAARRVFQNVNITTPPAGAGVFRLDGHAGDIMEIANVRISLSTANDVAISHVTQGVLTLDDLDILNPGAVAGTSGYVGGAGTAVRRRGRFNASATATAFTANQSDQGTFATTGATPVDVNFFDIRATGIVDVWMVTAAGTPAPDQTIAITAGTKFTFTGKAADTSTRGYKIHD
jgi:hypothetical protein